MSYAKKRDHQEAIIQQNFSPIIHKYIGDQATGSRRVLVSSVLAYKYIMPPVPDICK